MIEIDIAKLPYFGAFKKKDRKMSKSKDVHVDITLINFILEFFFDVCIEFIIFYFISKST